MSGGNSIERKEEISHVLSDISEKVHSRNTLNTQMQTRRSVQPRVMTGDKHSHEGLKEEKEITVIIMYGRYCMENKAGIHRGRDKNRGKQNKHQKSSHERNRIDKKTRKGRNSRLDSRIPSLYKLLLPFYRCLLIEDEERGTRKKDVQGSLEKL
jgi:hypothetical protein